MNSPSAMPRVASSRRASRPSEPSLPVVSIGSAKSSGSSTLALTLASAAAAAGIPVLVIDAANDGDLAAWAAKPGRPECIEVVRADKPVKLDALVREGIDRRAVVLVDAGTRPETLRAGARLAGTVLIPVRFSPLSAYAASTTDLFLSSETKGAAKRQAFVATAIAQIPSRIARAVERQLDLRPTERLNVGLAQRAAYEAPFMYGGTIFTLGESRAPGLKRAQAEAVAIASELDMLMRPGAKLAARIAETVRADRQQRAA